MTVTRLSPYGTQLEYAVTRGRGTGNTSRMILAAVASILSSDTQNLVVSAATRHQARIIADQVRRVMAEMRIVLRDDQMITACSHEQIALVARGLRGLVIASDHHE